MYCYDENGTCPYWSLDPEGEEQANGYCSFLEMGDKGMHIGSAWLCDCKPVTDVPDFISNGLLWDMVKECGINDEYDEQKEEA